MPILRGINVTCNKYSHIDMSVLSFEAEIYPISESVDPWSFIYTTLVSYFLSQRW